MNTQNHSAELQGLHSLFEKQRSAFSRSGASSALERQSHLSVLERALKVHGEPLAQAISADFGNRSSHETQLMELFPSLESAKHARRHLKSWMRPQARAVSLWFRPARARVVWQPLGVVGIIVPWNYPVLLAVGPLVSALAAGNRVMIKMSELAPRTAECFAALIREHFAEDHVAVLTGEADMAKAFASLPFDHLLFTGSTPVGRSVMHAAADNLTPVTLELGGKSPAIVAPGFPIELAASRIMTGKCLSAGQTCISPDYLLLPDGSEQAFIEAALAAVTEHYPTLVDNPDYTSIVNERHYQRLTAYLEDARQQGATVISLQPAQETTPDPISRKIAPTLLLNVHDDMRILQEEIFGPLLPIKTYRDLGEAIDYVNARPRPLALYCFDHDRRNQERILRETVCGGVTFNDTLLHVTQDELPFGGVGASGMGHYHGRDGFETFSKKKSVFVQSRWNLLPLLEPPYGRRFEFLMRFLLR